MSANIELTPIGVVHCRSKYRFETPRQGVFNGTSGVIELFPEYGGDAIADLAGFARMWVIFCFHLNQGHQWKPKVRPPYPAGGVCRSLFATRSPYRVNPLGLSCVKIEKVGRREIVYSGADMLDGTPVVDIKPYIPEADAFPDAAIGWREAGEPEWEVQATAEFSEQAAFINKICGLDLESFGMIQLANAPLDPSRKRIADLGNGNYALGCRTWRVIYTCQSDTSRVFLLQVRSNYQEDELLPGAQDRYQDKEFHRQFREKFG